MEVSKLSRGTIPVEKTMPSNDL